MKRTKIKIAIIFGALFCVVVVVSPIIAEALRIPTAELRKEHPEIKTVELSGNIMAYKVHGHGFPVIMIHGFTHSTLCWERNVEAVADAGFKVYTVDLFGHGLSDKPKELEYSRPYDIFSDQIYHFITKLGLGKVHLIGHSMGGGISIKLTCDHPEVVDKMVLIGSGGLTIDRPINVLLSVLNVPYLGEFIKLFEFRKMTEQSLQRITFNNQFEFSSEYLDYYIMPSTTKGWEAAFFGELRRYHSSDGGGDLSQCLNEIDKQTLIIHGGKDNMIPVEAGSKMHKLLKGSDFHEIEGAPHSVMESHAREVNDLLFHFLTPKSDVI